MNWQLILDAQEWLIENGSITKEELNVLTVPQLIELYHNTLRDDEDRINKIIEEAPTY